MSIKTSYELKCPFCGAVFEADLWTFVRGDIEYALKEKIMNGEFSLFMCPECGKVFSREETFIYMDPPMEIFAFIFPAQYASEKEKWIAKMKSDYASIGRNMEKEKLFAGGEPSVFFGISDFMKFLANDRDMEEETEVLRFLSEENEYSWIEISPSFARTHNLPFGLPCRKKADKSDLLSSASELLRLNGSLKRLSNLVSLLSDKNPPSVPRKK